MVTLLDIRNRLDVLCHQLAKESPSMSMEDIFDIVYEILDDLDILIYGDIESMEEHIKKLEREWQKQIIRHQKGDKFLASSDIIPQD